MAKDINASGSKVGLVLSGGGARAAYQAGVLKAVAELLPPETSDPFPIICGTSAGAINALAIAGCHGSENQRTFQSRIKKIESIWCGLEANNIYRSDLLGVLKNTLMMFFSIFNKNYTQKKPKALLDNTPLRRLLNELIDFEAINESINNKRITAVSITAVSYSDGKSVTFYDGEATLQPWVRSRRIGIRSKLTIDHIMASTAIPVMFPTTRIMGSYFGDGAIQQLKPISPALHLGANKIFIIGVNDNSSSEPPSLSDATNLHIHSPPSSAKIIGHILNSAFVDAIDSDLETLRNINRLAEILPAETREAKGISDLRPIKFLAISPSKSIGTLARNYFKELPLSMRFFLKIMGLTTRSEGIEIASYVMFSKGFCSKLVELGYQDGLAKQQAITEFLKE